MKRLLVLILLICTVPFARGQFSVSGTITDEQSGEPVVGAIVFVENTTYNTFSDAEGFYELEIKLPGVYTLIATHVSHERSILPLNIDGESVPLDFKMKVQSNEIEAVVVTPMSDEDRAYYLGVFKRAFLGRSPNAAQAQILNENDLDLFIEEGSGLLEVSSTVPIQISNKGLGYDIQYELVYFSYNIQEGRSAVFGFSRFTEKESRSKRKKKNWDKARKIAYSGSLVHLFKSLYNGDYEEQGFQLTTFKKVKNPDYPSQEYIDSIRNEPGAVSRAEIRKLSNKPKYITQVISMDPYESIVLKKDDLKYLFIPFHLRFEYLNEPDLTGISPKPIQTNDLSLDENAHQLFEVGLISNPGNLLVNGYLSTESIADLLPLDYEPEGP